MTTHQHVWRVSRREGKKVFWVCKPYRGMCPTRAKDVTHHIKVKPKR